MKGWQHGCEEGNEYDLLGNLSDPKARAKDGEHSC